MYITTFASPEWSVRIPDLPAVLRPVEREYRAGARIHRFRRSVRPYGFRSDQRRRARFWNRGYPRQSPNTIPEMRSRFARGRYELRNATLVDLIRTAWSVDADKVVGGSDWVGHGSNTHR
jgi:hypothetical protein